MSPMAKHDPQMTEVTLYDGSMVEGFIDTCHLSAVSPGVTNRQGNRTPVCKWLGIPYATAGRWERPRKTSWEGSKSCLEFGPIPMQPTNVPLEAVWDNAPGYHLRTHVGQSEDCLTANIFRPASVGRDARLPVFVFIYGGALRIGCSTKVRHDPTELVRHSERLGRPIVVVTFNYRVGIFGWLNHPDFATPEEGQAFGNYGLHDQLFFFRWLQQNVAEFRGDPKNITVMGNSAGAFSIAALMTRNRGERNEEMLFKRAIFESGAPCTMSWRSSSSHFPYYDKLLALAGCSPRASRSEKVAALRNLTSQQLMEFEGANFPFGNYGVTAEVGKGAIFSTPPFEALARGDWDPFVTEVMIGCVTHEASLSGAPLRITTRQGLLDYVQRCPAKLHEDLRELYPDPLKDEDSPLLARGNALLAHHVFTGPSFHLAEIFAKTPNKFTGRPLPTYIFRFNAMNPQVDPTGQWGAYHTSELSFLFNTDSLWPDASPQAQTAEQMGRMWTSFFYDGVPSQGWPRYDCTRPRAVLENGGRIVVESVNDAPDYAQLKWWHDVLAGEGHDAIRMAPLPNDYGKTGLGETVCA